MENISSRYINKMMAENDVTMYLVKDKFIWLSKVNEYICLFKDDIIFVTKYDKGLVVSIKAVYLDEEYDIKEITLDKIKVDSVVTCRSKYMMSLWKECTLNIIEEGSVIIIKKLAIDNKYTLEDMIEVAASKLDMSSSYFEESHNNYLVEYGEADSYTYYKDLVIDSRLGQTSIPKPYIVSSVFDSGNKSVFYQRFTIQLFIAALMRMGRISLDCKDTLDDLLYALSSEYELDDFLKQDLNYWIKGKEFECSDVAQVNKCEMIIRVLYNYFYKFDEAKETSYTTMIRQAGDVDWLTWLYAEKLCEDKFA